MKKNCFIAFALVGVLTLVGLLSGCGKKDDQPEATSSANIETMEAAMTEDIHPATESDEDDHDHDHADNSLGSLQTQPFSGTVRVIGMNRPASFGLSKLLKSNDQETSVNAYEFSLTDNLAELQNVFISGGADIAIMPITIASDLNNAMNGQLQLLAITTLNELYVVENGNSISDFASLKGKDVTICGVDMGAGEILNTLAKQNGLKNIDDVNVTWSEDPTNAVAALVDGDISMAVLPEPYATIALEQNQDLHIALDIGEEWAKQNEDRELPMNAIVSSREFVQENPVVINSFLVEYKQSTQYTLASPEDAADFLVNFNVWELKEQIEPAIPRSNLVFLTGDEMKQVAEPFFQTLADNQEVSVYQVTPEEQFYYIAQ